jgi:hypothetical protein
MAVKHPTQPAYRDYSKGNGEGQKGFDKFQQNVEKNLHKGVDGKKLDADSKEDRVDPRTGNVYTFDQDANGGKGAWGNSAKLTPQQLKDYNAGKDVSDDIKPYSEKDYEKASGLTNEKGTNGYDPKLDIKDPADAKAPNNKDKTPADGKKEDKTPADGKKEDKTPADGKKEDKTPADDKKDDKAPSDGQEPKQKTKT